jgi:hypothetical protein
MMIRRRKHETEKPTAIREGHPIGVTGTAKEI